MAERAVTHTIIARETSDGAGRPHPPFPGTTPGRRVWIRS